MKILVADDDPIFVRLFTEAFVKHGWSVVSAVDAMQALMVVQRDPSVDLIILDIGMPGGTGLRTLERLKASSKTAAIPVVVVTASDDLTMPDRVKSMGAVAFLHKPVDPDSLARARTRPPGTKPPLPTAGPAAAAAYPPCAMDVRNSSFVSVRFMRLSRNSMASDAGMSPRKLRSR